MSVVLRSFGNKVVTTQFLDVLEGSRYPQSVQDTPFYHIRTLKEVPGLQQKSALFARKAFYYNGLLGLLGLGSELECYQAKNVLHLHRHVIDTLKIFVLNIKTVDLL